MPDLLSPKILKNEDLTGDGIPDLVIQATRGPVTEKWMYIGQVDGDYIRADSMSQLIPFYRTEDGKIYLVDEDYSDSFKEAINNFQNQYVKKKQ